MLPLSRTALPILTFCCALAGQAHAESAAVPLVFITDVSVEEGDQGERSFSAQVSLQNWSGPVVVDLAAVPGSADAADYRFDTIRLALTPGAPAVTVTGAIRGDTAFESDESFQLRAMGTGQYPSFVSSSGGRITIRDDDWARASRLSIQSTSVAEGDQGTSNVALQVTLAPAGDNPVTVDYSTSSPLQVGRTPGARFSSHPVRRSKPFPSWSQATPTGSRARRSSCGFKALAAR